MTFTLFNAPQQEASQFVGFAGNVIERLSEQRSDDAVEAALVDPAARLIAVRSGRVYLKVIGEDLDPFYPPNGMDNLGPRLQHAVLLGRDSAGPVLAVPVGTEPDDLPETIKAIDFRSVYIQGLLNTEALGALAQGAALLAWHSSHRFCGRCGSPTEMRAGGYKRVCASCESESFPRTDPVAIMLAVQKDRCLLGRSPHFPDGMYSCLAGFVEPGETIENAVRRETLEEAGIRIGRVAYHSSQPWPFPYSLMIGCHGEALNDDISMDDDELEDCRWFTQAEVRAMLRGETDNLFVPPPGAIANHLIKAWANHELR